MKIKSEVFLFLIIVCILFSISAVSANEIQSDAIGIDNDYQSNIQLSQNGVSEYISETNDDEVTLDTQNENSKLGDEPGTFNQFHDDLINSGDTFNMDRDYAYDENDDPELGYIDIENLTINGNNHILDSKFAGDFVFKFSPKINDESEDENFTVKPIKLIINDLTFKNFNSSVFWVGGGNATLNNVNFTNCFSNSDSIITSIEEVNLTLNYCNFYSNSVYSYFGFSDSKLIINNSYFSGLGCLEGAMLCDRGQLIIENSIFEDFRAFHGSIINFKGDYFSIRSSKFLNSKANATGGAILAKYFPLYKWEGDDRIYIPSDAMLIENCSFYNLSSSSNGGAIHLDLDSGSQRVPQTLVVIDSNFTDCSSRFGGAISILGGSLNISGSNFKNNKASFEGGAIYSSFTNLNIIGSSFEGNTGNKNAGAMFFDKGQLIIKGSNFRNNLVLMPSNKTANAIYAHDVDVNFSDSVFDNGGIGVYADFAGDSQLINVTKNDDIFLMNNTDYILSVESKGIKINLTGNEIIVDTLPSRFDSRDWGWTTPGKKQGENDDCWAFATVASLESALLKATGVAYNLSQNYVQKLQLKYFKAGDLRISLTGFTYSGLGYALSWYGVLPMDNIYDDRGMIVDTDLDDARIHVQDALIIYTGQNDTVENLKRAIMKYGAVTVQYYVSEPQEEIPTEGDDISIMEHGTHFISLVGWDDNFYNDTEPNDDAPFSKFAWITKDSLTGFSQISYTDFSGIDYYAIAPQRAAIAYIFENTIDYHVNYQTDLTGLAGFDGNYTIYSNEFTSKYSELIGAVGTYFNESGIEYSFDIFVNDQKVHSQTGVSEFSGFRTIVLDKYIPIKTGDQFKVVFMSNSVPYQAWSRVHYMNGTSLVSNDGNNWTDFAPLNKTVCLKVYTVVDDTKIIDNENVTVDYGNGFFSVKIVTADGRAVGAGEVVNININGKTILTLTDDEGIAKVKITEVPGTYDITITLNGQTYKNKVTVKLNPVDCKITQNKNIKVDYDGGKYFSVKIISADGKVVASGVSVKFTINGKATTVKTDKNGIAKVKITQIPKKYTITTTFNGKSVKNTVTVKQVLKASKVTVKKTAKKFSLKATLKINGKKVKGKKITFKFNGKTYKAKTNKKGIAKVTIKKKVIKKLKKGKKYTVKVTYLKDAIKTTVKVK